MTRQDAVKWINGSTRIFAILFWKRSDNTLRLMNCRRKCLSRLRGGQRAYSEASANVLTVFDMTVHGMGDYRCVPIEGIVGLKVDGVWHPVCDPATWASMWQAMSNAVANTVTI